MLEDGLVDELHLFMFPVAVTTGDRLFQGGGPKKFDLAACETFENGALHLDYRRAADKD
jgi:dihydrofolate reductase